MLSGLLLISTVAFVSALTPTCPNGQQPKRDKENNMIQCLPGSLYSEDCGTDHICFFSGMNYMCCPSNEPSPTNQPVCPAPLLTVLKSTGQPLKCSPASRRCPKDNMYCLDVGLDFICCEKTAEEVTKKTPDVDNKNVKKNIRKSNACPRGSIAVINEDRENQRCHSDRDCLGASQFCNGKNRKVCCERILSFESIKPVSQEKPKIRKPIRLSGDTMLIRKKIAHSNESQERDSTALQKNISVSSSIPTTTVSSTQASTTPMTSSSTTTTQNPQVHTPARVLSRRLNGIRTEDNQKRVAMQQFLIDQIKNGWPYDERFYRGANNNIRLL